MGIEQEQAAARRANELRYAQMMDIYNKVIARAQPGGAFEKAGLAEIERAKTKGVGTEMQQMISSGMYGTTTAAGVPARWEAEVGAPARLRLEDIMEQRLTQAQLGKIGGIERREDVYPDVGAYAEYERVAATAPEESLQDWMDRTLGKVQGIGGVSRPTPTPFKPAYGATQLATKKAVKDYTPGKPGEITMKPLTKTPTERKGFEVPITGEVPSYFAAPVIKPVTKPTYYADPWATPTTKKKKTYGPPTPYYGAGGGWKDWK